MESFFNGVCRQFLYRNSDFWGTWKIIDLRSQDGSKMSLKMRRLKPAASRQQKPASGQPAANSKQPAARSPAVPSVTCMLLWQSSRGRGAAAAESWELGVGSWELGAGS